MPESTPVQKQLSDLLVKLLIGIIAALEVAQWITPNDAAASRAVVEQSRPLIEEIVKDVVEQQMPTQPERSSPVAAPAEPAQDLPLTAADIALMHAHQMSERQLRDLTVERRAALNASVPRTAAPAANCSGGVCLPPSPVPRRARMFR